MGGLDTILSIRPRRNAVEALAVSSVFTYECV